MLVNVGNDFVQAPISFELTGPRPKEIKVETFRIDYLIRAPKVEKLSLQPGVLKRIQPRGPRFRISGSRFGILGFEVQGFEFRVSGLGFRVSGLGFRV